MEKIKILYTIPNFDTAGSGKALLNLAMGLDKNRFTPEILCLHTKGAFFETVKQSGIPIHVFDYLPKERPLWQLLLNCWKVSRKLKQINPQIIHSFHYNSNYSEALAAKGAGITWTFTKKNMSWGGASKNSWKLRSFLADKIVVQNTDMIKEFYPKSKKIKCIPRGVVLEQFASHLPKQEIRQLMETGTEKRVVITVANLVPIKNIELLLTAFEQIHSANSDWVLWIIGEDTNEYGQSLKHRVANSNLNDKVKFSGKQLKVIDFLNHAEIFVLPTASKGEGSPVALLEAMANGKVVLGTAVPGIKDQLIPYQDHLFNPENTQSLVEKLSFFMKRTTVENKELGQEFCQWVSRNYDIEQEINHHEQYYIELLS
jgi:glycosyltransferase involved in cell wall biosynthesis